MYEELYESIPDVDAYLARLHLKRPKKLDKAYLDSLIYAHQRYIVFENLDSYLYHRPVSLEIRKIYEKIIEKGRGGYCFELNALLNQLMRDLGYEAYGCMARILRKKDFIPPVLHRGILVKLDGDLYFCDVGYGGPMPPGAILVEEGAVLNARGEYYYMNQSGEGWWMVSRITSSKKEEKVIEFHTVPQEAVNFLPLSEYCSHSPDSIFTQKPFFNRRTDCGSVGILGDTFTRVDNGVSTVTRIETTAQLYAILEEEFELPSPLKC